ncbi:MAG TPA: hypothetical protein DEB32_10155 [Stenotrophomonas sp.]|nr:hypothetical protein [Stenotrophomonas sp.]
MRASPSLHGQRDCRRCIDTRCAWCRSPVPGQWSGAHRRRPA